MIEQNELMWIVLFALGYLISDAVISYLKEVNNAYNKGYRDGLDWDGKGNPFLPKSNTKGPPPPPPKVKPVQNPKR